jgi:hypothetical protein
MRTYQKFRDRAMLHKPTMQIFHTNFSFKHHYTVIRAVDIYGFLALTDANALPRILIPGLESFSKGCIF